ncbi:alpha/beta fold hydrolase [Primorskyibacter sp. S87]|uniref:alpha/beta fold hydrolase n=1 Tax=Primorskyibacter sp. S87 TaxID=3415126 RepID=UPI003C7CB0A1
MTFVILLILVAIIAIPYVREWRRKPMDERARQDLPGEMVTLSQGNTYFRWHGPLRGPVAVCVHGLSTPSFVWDGMAGGLSAMGYRVLTYDLYGRGYSDRVPGTQDAAFFVRQLEDLLESQKVGDDITLFGYSMGGAIATSFASTHIDRVRHLVLLAPSGAKSSQGRMVRFIRDTPVLGDWLMLAHFPRKYLRGTEAERDLPSSVPGIVDLQQRELNYRGYIAAILSSLRGILSNDLETEHRHIHSEGVPVLAIWGRKDEVIPKSAIGKLSEWSRDARQEMIDDAGHGLPYTHTDQIMQILGQRLREGLN